MKRYLSTISKSFILTGSLLLFGCQSTKQVHYDTVILNGRVMDPETNFDQVTNMGITDGRISIITHDAITGKENIDAKGLVVAPGFIDTHFHSLDMFAVKFSMRDGVTTGMDLEYGAWPIAPWYKAKKDNWPINYGTLVSQEIIRMIVHDGLKIDDYMDASTALSTGRDFSAKDGVDGWSVTKSSLAQINQISKMLDQGMMEGALGLGSSVGYMTKGVTTYEMFDAQRAAARYGRMTGVHTRFHGSSATPVEAPLAFDEVFTNAFLLDAPLLMSHNNDYGWWEIEEKLQMARAKGLNMWSEYYPYDAASTSIGSEQLKPASLEEALGYKYEDVMYDPRQDKFLSKDEYLKTANEDPGRIVVLFIPPRKKWLPHWLSMPHMTVAGDGMMGVNAKGELLDWDADYSEYSGHPRTAGSHAKALRLGREHNIPLMHTLSQLSYWSALHLGDAGVDSMKIRGRMQEGMIADITIFNPKTVKDNAGYKKGTNGLPSTGIPFVLVNGQLVVKNNKAIKVMAGQEIRCKQESKSRHEPLSKEQWLKDFSIDTSPLKRQSTFKKTNSKNGFHSQFKSGLNLPCCESHSKNKMVKK
jgi:N-acyl-D-amino-acid deacylase